MIEDAQKLPEASSEKFINILEYMKARAIAERERREKAEKETEKPAVNLLNPVQR